jgi:hypothetical protein
MDKVCTKCNTEFVMTEYQIKKYDYQCRSCKNSYKREYLKANPPKIDKEKRKKTVRNYYLRNQDKIKQYREKNKERSKEYNIKYQSKNSIKIKERALEWYKNNKLRANKLNSERVHNLVESIADSYVIQLIKGQSGVTPNNEIIEQRRLQLKIKRRIKEVKQLNPQL